MFQVQLLFPLSKPSETMEFYRPALVCTSASMLLTPAHVFDCFLQRHEANRLKQQLEAVLAAGGAGPGVMVSLTVDHPVTQVILNAQAPQVQDDTYCAVFVDLAVEQQLPSADELAAAPGDALRVLRTVASGVQRMCQTAALLLSCGRLQGVGGPGAATKAPRVACISMVGSLGCCLAVSRHRMLGKLLLRTSKVRLV
jgi:hypothetical protein